MFVLLRYPYFYYKVLFMTYRRPCLERTACVHLAATQARGHKMVPTTGFLASASAMPHPGKAW